jgi:hypothetical protein
MKKELRKNESGHVWPFQNVLRGDKVKVTLPDGHTFTGIVTSKYESDCGYAVRTCFDVSNEDGTEYIYAWTDRTQPKIKVLKHGAK